MMHSKRLNLLRFNSLTHFGVSSALILASLSASSRLSKWKSCSRGDVVGQTMVADSTSGPSIRIDLNSLSPEVLKCNVCRMRLGLAPIAGGGSLDVAAHDAAITKPAASAEATSPSIIEVEKAVTLKPEAIATTSPSDEVVGTSIASSQAATAQTTAATEPVVAQELPAANDKPQSVTQEETKASDAKLTDPQSDNVNANRLSQFASPAEAATTAASPEVLSQPAQENPRFSSPSALQIELELAKRQLKESHELIERFNQNQSQLESQIDQLTAANRHYESSMQNQTQATEKLTAQLSEKNNQHAVKLNELQRELESTKRELSKALAQQKILEREQASSEDSRTAELQTQIDSLRNEVESFKSQAELMKRQRDGLERELAAARNRAAKDAAQSNTPADEAQLAAAQSKINELETLIDRYKSELRKRASESATNALQDSPATAAVGKDSDGQQDALQKQVEALRTQIEQQAAQMLSAQATWDDERAKLMQKLAEKESLPELHHPRTPHEAPLVPNLLQRWC